jgi:hypothetical protein
MTGNFMIPVNLIDFINNTINIGETNDGKMDLRDYAVDGGYFNVMGHGI